MTRRKFAALSLCCLRLPVTSLLLYGTSGVVRRTYRTPDIAFPRALISIRGVRLKEDPCLSRIYRTMAAASHVSRVFGGSAVTKTNELTSRSVRDERNSFSCSVGVKGVESETSLKSRTTVTHQNGSQSRQCVTRAAKKGFGDSIVTKAPEKTNRAESPLSLEVTETPGENCCVSSSPIHNTPTVSPVPVIDNR